MAPAEKGHTWKKRGTGGDAETWKPCGTSRDGETWKLNGTSGDEESWKPGGTIRDKETWMPDGTSGGEQEEIRASITPNSVKKVDVQDTTPLNPTSPIFPLGQI